MPIIQVNGEDVGQWCERINLRTGPGVWISGSYEMNQGTFEIGAAAAKVQLIDLGILNAIDLTGGPVTLYTPSGPEYVEIVVGDNDFVPRDDGLGFPIAAYMGTPGWATDPNFFVWQSTDVSPLTVQTNSWPRDLVLSAPVVAGWFFAMAQQGPLVGWQAGHAYDANGDDIVEAGHFWRPNISGVSGLAPPDFVGGIGGGTGVDDGTITGGWNDQGAIPTQGSVHLYALVATS